MRPSSPPAPSPVPSPAPPLACDLRRPRTDRRAGPRFAALGAALLALTLLSFAGWGRADAVATGVPECRELVAALSEAFDAADGYRSVTVVTGGRGGELYYQEAVAVRNGGGEFETEVVEERSSLPFPTDAFGEGGGNDDEEPRSPEEICAEADTTPSGEDGWRVELVPEDGALERWYVDFEPYREGWLPVAMGGEFDVRILMVPLRGAFESRFEAWDFPLDMGNPNGR